MTFRHILVATDFSDSAARALDLGIELAQRFQADLTLVHSWDAPSYSYGSGLYVAVDMVTPIAEAANAHLEQALVELKQRVPGAKCMLRSGTAWEEILTAAEQLGADLIVLGTHGRRGLSRALLGSVAERVVRLAKVPVLTAHAPRADG